MRNHNSKTKIPFVVSLSLIFAYSMLMAAVPPKQSGVEARLTEQAPPLVDPAQAPLVLRVSTDQTPQGQPERSLQ